MNFDYSWYDFVGNIGVLLIVSAYLLLQIEKITTAGFLYSVVNGVGASFIIFSLMFEFNLSAFIIEFFWLLISILGFALQIRRSLRARTVKQDNEGIPASPLKAP